MTEWKKTICPYDCPTSCGLLVKTDGTRILEVKGDPDHPAAHGLICRKMHGYADSILSLIHIYPLYYTAAAKGMSGYAQRIGIPGRT